MKKVIKIAASTAVAASAFVAVAPTQQADAATNATTLATNAQNAGTVLKWAISYEGSADFTTRPYNEFNAAKKAVAAAEAAAAKLPTTEKLSLQAKLVDAKIQIVRATAYIDAITSSEKIKELTANLNSAVASNDIEKVETAYHKATAEYRKQAALLDRVYGQSTRDGIRNAVKPALEKLIAELKNDVTVNMLSKAAAADVKAVKLEDAAKKINEAQAILDANVLKWETALQKSIDDVATSLPLIAVGATYVDANTVQVKLSKKVDAVNLSQFTIDGLTINSVSLGSDKQTVTLKTGTQAAGKSYTVEFNGKTVSYTTPASGTGPTIGLDKNAVRANVGDNIAVQASFKEKTGQAYSGEIRVTPPEGTTIVTINGNSIDSTEAVVVTPNQSGTVTVVLTSTDLDASVDGEQVKFEKLFNNSATETSYSGAVYFYLKADSALPENTVVDFVDATNKYFVVDNGDNLVKYSVKSIDAFTNVNDNGLTLDQFFAALNKGDEVTVPVYGATTTSASHFKIAFNKTINDFGFASKYFVLKNEDEAGAYRVDTNGKFSLEGDGQPGYTVHVFSEAGTEYTTTVKANGTWSVDVNLDQLGIEAFAAVQTPAGEKPNYANAELLNVREGAFVVEEITVSDRASETANALLGRTITLEDTEVTVNDSFVIKSGASITLIDDDGTKVKYTNGQNAEFVRVATDGVYSTVNIKITGSQQLLAAGTQSGLADTFSIDSITGLSNSYGLVATPATNVLAK